jgi:hypothetical protein
METKLTIDPDVIIKSFKSIGNSDHFTQIWVAAAYYVKHHGRLPAKFNQDEHPVPYKFFTEKIKPILDGKPVTENTLNDIEKEELYGFIKRTSLFDQEEKKVLKDMLDMWFGRGKYSRTELIYTQSMAWSRAGVPGDKFSELRKWLKAEECLTWENRPYNDYLTSYHMFNERKLYNLFKEDCNDN